MGLYIYNAPELDELDLSQASDIGGVFVSGTALTPSTISFGALDVYGGFELHNNSSLGGCGAFVLFEEMWSAGRPVSRR